MVGLSDKFGECSILTLITRVGEQVFSLQIAHNNSKQCTV